MDALPMLLSPPFPGYLNHPKRRHAGDTPMLIFLTVGRFRRSRIGRFAQKRLKSMRRRPFGSNGLIYG